MHLKIAFIGAGSVGFCRRLAMDLLIVEEFRESAIEFALHDISEQNLDMVATLLEKDLAANDLPARITRHLERAPALDGAKYVINCTRIGGLDAYQSDIDIPLQYGIDQCVGDTICAGGIMYGQRNIPAILDFQQDMARRCADDALFLNYANPMAINTWAALDAYDRGEGINTVGLCHGVQHGHWQIAEVLAHYHGESELMKSAQGDLDGYTAATRLVEIVCIGINHQTWYTDIRYQGRPVSGDELLAAFESHPEFSKTEKVRIDVLRRFGYYSTESNGHLSEYLPWYRKRPEEIHQWIDLSSWIHGETGGYLRYNLENKNWFKTDFPKWLEKAGQPIKSWKRTNEHGSYIIESIETSRPYRGHFNVRNNGTITNLPPDCIIEAPGYVDRFGINMITGHTLPQACAATCRASIDVQRMAKDAALTGDRLLLKQAMLHDPLTAAVCNPEEIWQLTDHLLSAQADWLPQYISSGAVEAARVALSDHEKAGTRITLRDWSGAARIPVKSIEQLRMEDQSNILETDPAAAVAE